MGSLGNEKFHAKRREAVGELIKGKEIATHLKALLMNRVWDDDVEDMAVQIFRSFSVSLAHITPGAAAAESAQISAVDCGGAGGSKRRRGGAKDRRGCYKRRKSSDSWVTVSPTIEDGWAWRKYGQKNILNSEHPRCYYRCSHKQEGCKALRQVQRMKGGSGEAISYETTYFNHHTCAETLRGSQYFTLQGPDPVQRNIISFQTNNQSKPPITLSSVKQEDAQSTEEASDIDHEPKSTMEDTWQDIIGHDLPEWAPYQIDDQYSSEIGSLHGLHMEVDQLSDINSFHCFDHINY